MNPNTDTIAAISTPIGEGGIGIVRLSGPEAKAIAERLFPRRLSHRRLVYGHIIDTSGEVVDEVLVAYMAAPHTYTHEDMVEINAHGGPLPLQRILELVLRGGARLAQPGEFTLRAFLNGRIDLAQAEAVLDVIRAKTAASLRLALQGLGGRLSKPVKTLNAELTSVLAYLTATIDFPEDEVPPQDIGPTLRRAQAAIDQLIATADSGMVYRQGVRTAIVGRPNVGKSSLLNCLLRENRAIVTPIPGTTRDTLEEIVNLKGVPFILVDTAGIAVSKDLVEHLGVERSHRAIEQADLLLWVVDASEQLTAQDEEIKAFIGDKTTLVVANKADLPRHASLTHLAWPQVSTSALTGQGIPDLERAMVSTVLAGKIITSDAPLVSNPRHKDALERGAKHLTATLASYEANLPADFITIDLTAAINALGEITGETVAEGLLEAIFSQFCVGK
ncbi:MAG: tRNA uridine-5-carboxymethylaminomethyl(34) synthesis GTPase MnmE [Chloroflexi bacterium]|nr:tRNA uridine-5-carboxymethylaminomethyl(34) synthesis GTPase MnmE [Chloroflexota bacterium]